MNHLRQNARPAPRRVLRPPLRQTGMLLMLAAAALSLSSSHIAAATAPARVQTVAIRNFAFVPQVVTVAPGTTVTWINADEDPHTVIANDRSFHSAALDEGDKYSFTFTKPGDYAYFCSLHPHMTAKIIVKG